MDSVDLDVIRTSVQWLHEGHDVLLATVVSTWGSSPRPEGAMLALRGDGRIVGSVDTVIGVNLDERSAVIALTHDPKLDDLALMEALKTPAFYVGALGSRRNNAARRERLKLFDVSGEQVARLRGPAGLYIGSKTPSEIAVSILAEVTAHKNGVRPAEHATVEEGKRRRERKDRLPGGPYGEKRYASGNIGRVPTTPVI